jgi:hypothetical protein
MMKKILFFCCLVFTVIGLQAQPVGGSIHFRIYDIIDGDTLILGSDWQAKNTKAKKKFKSRRKASATRCKLALAN